MSNIMVKTAIFGIAGLCLAKVIADAHPEKVNAGCFQDKIDSITSKVNDIYEHNTQHFQNLKKNLYGSGSDDDESQKVLDMYDDAHKKVVEAKNNLDSNIDKEDREGNFWATPISKDDLQKKYDDAKDVLENLKNSINEYTHGDSAESFGDKIQSIITKAQNYAAEKYNSITEDKLNANVEYYNKQAAIAKKEWDDTKSSWLKWRKAQSEEIQDIAEAKYNYFKEKNEDAIDQLISYLEKNGQDTKDKLNKINQQSKEYAQKTKNEIVGNCNDFKEKANQHVHHAKNYANAARDRMASVGYGAKESIYDDAEYAKNKVADANGRVVETPYDVNENLGDNVKYAKHNVADITDRLVQVGYDTKDNIEDNAEYAKHRVAGIKDRVAQAGYDTRDKIVEDADFVKGQANEYVSGAKEWIGRTGSFIKDQYNSMWNSLGIFNANSKEVAEDAVKYYDQQVALAKKEYDETQASWFRWRKAESQEIQDKARTNFEIMKAKGDSAKEELKRWTNKEN